jgi:hypothetical protein
MFGEGAVARPARVGGCDACPFGFLLPRCLWPGFARGLSAFSGQHRCAQRSDVGFSNAGGRSEFVLLETKFARDYPLAIV